MPNPFLQIYLPLSKILRGPVEVRQHAMPLSHAALVSAGLVVTAQLPLTPALSLHVGSPIEHERSGPDSHD